MKFSVIIPALNEERTVAKAISALKKQNVHRTSFEIIVVDNNSDDRTAQRAKEAGADKVILEKNLGTNIARQAGVEVSKGKIVAFLDADCEPPPNWLSKIEDVISRRGVVAVSGPYRYGKAFPDFVVRHIYPVASRVMPLITRKKGGVILGGNFAVYRSAIDKIGGLPPLRFFGDDTAIAVLLARRVGRVVYTKSLWVKSSPRRFEEKGIVKAGLKYFRHYFKIYFDKKYR